MTPEGRQRTNIFKQISKHNWDFLHSYNEQTTAVQKQLLLGPSSTFYWLEYALCQPSTGPRVKTDQIMFRLDVGK